MSAGEEGKTRVTFVWEPVPPVPGSERRVAPARLSVMAAGSDGPAYFRGRVPDERAPTESSTVANARGGRATFDANPGGLQVKLNIEDAGGIVLDSDILDLQVPDFTSPEVSLSTLEVHRIRTARDLQALNAEAAPVPVATREFRRTERLIVRFQPIAPGMTPPTSEARLLNRTGQSMTALPVQPVPNAEGRFQVDLPLSGLAAGEYLVEVKATAGSGETKQLLGFRVVS
jgi:hypothetical protein